ncbi:MAG: hypothetical protein ACHQ9S_22685 [Candidatus Binatia bacterium]
MFDEQAVCCPDRCECYPREKLEEPDNVYFFDSLAELGFNFAYVTQEGGKLKKLRFVIPGTAAAVFDALKSKYGKPRSYQEEPVQNAFGARGTRRIASWHSGTLVIEYYSPDFDKLDRATVTVATRTYLKEQSDEQKKHRKKYVDDL